MSTPTDAELNALFAEKVAGWAYLEAKHASPDGWTAKVDAWVDKFGTYMEPPSFATDINAVLPLLENEAIVDVSCCRVEESWHVHVVTRTGGPFSATAPTFAKAAVLALLKAHSVTAET